jgi:hypothetical protein
LIATADPKVSINHGEKVVVEFQIEKMHAFQRESPHQRFSLGNYQHQKTKEVK